MEKSLKKILVIRLSSIGDIVLTTPILRCLSQQTDAEIHFLTKKQFLPIVSENPNIEKIWAFEKSVDEILDALKREDFDLVVDLHKNIRTLKIKRLLGKKSTSFPKLNFQKWVYVNTKWDLLPDLHIVDRYFEAVRPLGVRSDDLGLDFFLPANAQVDLTLLTNLKNDDPYAVLTLGAQYQTKCLPEDKMAELLGIIDQKVLLLGGKEDQILGEKLALLFPDRVFNLAGHLSLHESAWVIDHSTVVIAHDTGLMHIAAAKQKPIALIWGNTTPKIGMGPYLVKNAVQEFEVRDLKCRPCSKIGFQQCPKRHFKCMRNQDLAAIATFVHQRFQHG